MQRPPGGPERGAGPLERQRRMQKEGVGVERDVVATETRVSTAEAELSRVEAGAAGLGLLALAVLWCLCRLPGGLKRVGSSDRSLAFGLIGAALSFSLLAVVHWTIELTAVAVSVSALGGTWNRWLAGGTDLFVERG